MNPELLEAQVKLLDCDAPLPKEQAFQQMRSMRALGLEFGKATDRGHSRHQWDHDGWEALTECRQEIGARSSPTPPSDADGGTTSEQITLIERHFPSQAPDARDEELDMGWWRSHEDVGTLAEKECTDDGGDRECIDAAEAAVSQRIDNDSNAIDYIDTNIAGCMKASRDLCPVAVKLFDKALYGHVADQKVADIKRDRDLGSENFKMLFSFIEKVAIALLGNGYSHGRPFGSRVSGYHLPTSDYDLCLLFRRGTCLCLRRLQ